MQIRKFEAKTLSDALAMVRGIMGSEAVILHTKYLRNNGIFGWIKGHSVEVTAATDNNGGIESLHKGEKHFQMPDSKGIEYSCMNDLKSEIKEIKSYLSKISSSPRLVQMPPFSEKLLTLYHDLIKNDVCEPVAYDVIFCLSQSLNGNISGDFDSLRSELKEKIKETLKISGAIKLNTKKKIAFFIGPTGVGKTTTIAKLAAHYRFIERCKIILMTIDTYRIAAVDQLRTYAEIIGIPLEVVITPEELKKALRKHQNADLVLVDTAGRSQGDKNQILELKPFLCNVGSPEIHLVMSITTKNSDLVNIIDKFKPLVPNRIVITKIDETSSFGSILNINIFGDLPISYITTGQEVPDDIEEADSDRLANLIVLGSK